MRVRLGRPSLDDVESTMTPDQVQLHLHWHMREVARSIKITEMGLKRAIAWAFPAK